MTLETYDNFYVIKNVLTDSQINTLIDWWNNQDYLLDTDGQAHVEHINDWDYGCDKKQKINSPIRTTDIVGIASNTFTWLDTIYSNIFATVHGSSLTIEYPSYFNKYDTGGYHQIHNDIKDDDWPNRKWVCTIQLSDPSDYIGGDLQIHKYENDIFSSYDYMTAPRDKGCAIIYNPRAVHSVTEITSGIRYALSECAG